MSERVSVAMLTLLSDDPATVRYYGGIARTLDQRRFRLLFGTVRPSGRVQEVVAGHGHGTFSLGCTSRSGYLPAILRLARLLRRERIDIVHGNEELASFLSGASSWLARRGRRIYHRQHDVSTSSFNYDLVDRLAGMFADSVLTLTEAHRRIVLEERPGWASRATVAYHGVDAPSDLGPSAEEAGQIRRSLGIGDGAPCLTFVARLNWRKGHRFFFEALSILRDRPLQEQPYALIVGYGPDEAALRSQAERAGLDRVRFAGAQSNVWPYYLAGLAAVMPSVTEPFGLVAAEAMACSRPVIASRVGGLPEVIEDGTCGVLVPPEDPRALADAIESVIEDAPRASAMGAEARRRYERLFSQEAMTRRWEAHYDTLVRGRGGR